MTKDRLNQRFVFLGVLLMLVAACGQQDVVQVPAQTTQFPSALSGPHLFDQPKRIYDSRTDPVGRLINTSRFLVCCDGTDPAVKAVIVNVTAIGRSESGWLTIGPTAQNSSSLNWTRIGEVSANEITALLVSNPCAPSAGATSAPCPWAINAHVTGEADVIIDLIGYLT